MPRLTHLQTNFTAGEITPRMKGRPDVARYQNGALVIENGIVSVHGGVDRRPGLRYLATAKHGGTRKVDLVRYRFSVDQAYLLEFGHQYVRFYASNGAQLLDDSLNPLEIASPYTEDQVFQVTREQGGDTMFLFHPDVPTHRLRRAGTRWSLEPVPWIVQPFAELGRRPNARLTISDPSVGSGRTFTTAAVDPPDAPTIGTATPFNGAAVVSFTPPADNGGAAITGYTVTASPGGATGTGLSSPITVPGLTNGVAYTFTVTATNIAGTSTASAASNSVTPLASLPSPTFSVGIVPSPLNGSTGNGTEVFPGPTATATGSSGAVTFVWQKISGGSGINLVDTTGAQPRITSTGFNATNYMTARVTATDSAGGTGQAVVNISISHRTALTPPGGGGGGPWPIEP